MTGNPTPGRVDLKLALRNPTRSGVDLESGCRLNAHASQCLPAKATRLRPESTRSRLARPEHGKPRSGGSTRLDSVSLGSRVDLEMAVPSAQDTKTAEPNTPIQNKEKCNVE